MDTLPSKELTFQERVRPWMLACFGEEISSDIDERNHRFLEESLELVQSLGCSKDDALKLVDYVYGRKVGEPYQEVGGVMVTLAALCLANSIRMDDEAETELARIWTKIDQIRAKQAAKPKHSPLPGPTHEPRGDAAAWLVKWTEFGVNCSRSFVDHDTALRCAANLTRYNKGITDCEVLPLYSAPPPGVQQLAWLVERQEGGRAVWCTANYQWTTDAHEAAWFVRKADAELFCWNISGEAVAAEHMFCSKPSSIDDEPRGCVACGAIAGCCDKYPNCPGNPSYSTATKPAVPCEHDLLKPETTVVAESKWDAYCTVCKEQWHLPRPTPGKGADHE